MTAVTAHPVLSSPSRRRIEQPPRRPRVVVIGGGFGGVAAARHLARLPVDLTLVDRDGTHTVRPLLYQVGVERQGRADVVRPRAEVLAGPVADGRLDLVTAAVTGIDREERLVRLHDGRTLPYDQLVVAAGAAATHLGVPGAADHAVTFTDADGADALRARLAPLLDRRTPPCTVVVVGGGPTGVELAGAVAPRAPAAGRRDLHVELLEAGPHLLAGYAPTARHSAERTLTQRGVRVRLGDPVAEVEGGMVRLASGDAVPAALVLWATGVAVHPVAAVLGLPVVETGPARGRVPVDASLRLVGHDDVFVIGDLAGAVDRDGRPLPQLAPVALQQGTHVAREVRRALRGEAPRPFRFTDKGRLAMVADGVAVADLPGGIDLPAPATWALWLVVHALTMPTPGAAVDVTRRWIDAATPAVPLGPTARRARRILRHTARRTAPGRLLVDSLEQRLPPLPPLAPPAPPGASDRAPAADRHAAVTDLVRPPARRRAAGRTRRPTAA
ncbi:MAG: FAD-dependent oxidoreductase [Acidimicrobiales bacterium]